MTVSMSYDGDGVQTLRNAILYGNNIETSSLSYTPPLSRHTYRLIYDDTSQIGVCEHIPLEDTITPMYYDDYALISSQLKSYDELVQHLNYSGNELLSVNGDRYKLRLRIRTDHADNDIDAMVTTDPSLAMWRRDNIIETTGDMDSELQSLKELEEKHELDMIDAYTL